MKDMTELFKLSLAAAVCGSAYLLVIVLQICFYVLCGSAVVVGIAKVLQAIGFTFSY